MVQYQLNYGQKMPYCITTDRGSLKVVDPQRAGQETEKKTTDGRQKPDDLKTNRAMV
jgi:hypothetical protein